MISQPIYFHSLCNLEVIMNYFSFKNVSFLGVFVLFLFAFFAGGCASTAHDLTVEAPATATETIPAESSSEVWNCFEPLELSVIKDALLLAVKLKKLLPSKFPSAKLPPKEAAFPEGSYCFASSDLEIILEAINLHIMYDRFLEQRADMLFATGLTSASAS